MAKQAQTCASPVCIAPHECASVCVCAHHDKWTVFIFENREGTYMPDTSARHHRRIFAFSARRREWSTFRNFRDARACVLLSGRVCCVTDAPPTERRDFSRHRSIIFLYSCWPDRVIFSPLRDIYAAHALTGYATILATRRNETYN